MSETDLVRLNILAMSHGTPQKQRLKCVPGNAIASFRRSNDSNAYLERYCGSGGTSCDGSNHEVRCSGTGAVLGDSLSEVRE